MIRLSPHSIQLFSGGTGIINHGDGLNPAYRPHSRDRLPGAPDGGLHPHSREPIPASSELGTLLGLVISLEVGNRKEPDTVLPAE